ncbi:hypothetical protein QK292_14300 [Arthrobacter sp. AL08]|uniref:hypothetical protein n=1 Tax=Micrococcaceae TaxID=1268 RepID=UPI001CFFA26B|nr:MULTISPECIES: hypothetical protein [Micrococcaceae]MDI3242726.1 hypothetical protein [Arthrobacter sp. AL05]MDI3278737.1 hypothetical protein [Arthrobacter sp. AL08]MDJ0353058.1 hypothetical protein [Pseudarthrobacter sp. PH31-O2]WGZ79841.1 hypothetical protein QI450_00845 [Arthrobacter sp. EM1]
MTQLVGKYHDGGPRPGATAGGGRRHRLVVALHPSLRTPPTASPKTSSANEQDNERQAELRNHRAGMTVHDFSAGKDSAAAARAWGGFLEKVCP